MKYLSIIYPLVAMALFAMSYVFVALGARIQAVRTGTLQMSYFRTYQGEASELVVKTSRHFANLFEMPVLFYVVCLIVLILKYDDVTYAVLGYGYVLMRVIHALIHTTYNQVHHRLAAFAVSNAVLACIWLRIIFQLTTD